MGVAKVNYNDETLIDLTADTVIADTLLAGETAHDAEGNPVVGLYTPPAVQLAKTVEITENGSHTIQPDEGYNGVGAVTANVNVPATPKTASGSVNVKMETGTTSFTCGTVNFTPVACGWSVNYGPSSTNVVKGASYNFGGTSYGGVGVRNGRGYSIVTGGTTLSGSTISGSIGGTLGGAQATYTVTVNWWAVGV